MNRSGKFAAVLVTALMIGAFVLLPARTPAAAQDTTSDSQPVPTVSVSGSGQVQVKPDMAVVTLGVQTAAKEASQAMSDNNTTMQSVVDALQKAGIAESDIRTQVIQLQPRYEQSQPTPAQPQTQSAPTGPQLVGYTATNTVSVRVKDLSTVGQVLDTAVQAGANQVQGISFEISDSSAALDQAREAAWADAQHKAEKLASLAGVQLGAVQSVQENSGGPGPIVQERFAAPAAAGVPIQPGTQTVQVSLQVIWQLK